MNIAVLTWFHYHNYGTALQVTALSEWLTKHGNKVDIVNYRPDGQVVAIPSESIVEYYFQKTKSVLRRRRQHSYNSGPRTYLFEEFYKEMISFTSKCETYSDFCNLNQIYDAFICGSDQIWAPSCYDSRYFLDFVEQTDRMIAYAPSIGLSTISDKDIEQNMKRLAARFRWISTRERSGSEMLSDLIGKEVMTVLDPTLLLGIDEWAEIVGALDKREEPPYLLAYFLGSNEHHWKKTYEIASELHLKVKIIPAFDRDIGRQGCIEEAAGPKEFLRYVKNAGFICTDSFHGTVFSINFNKNFMVFERFSAKEKNNQNSRIYNILDITGLQRRLFKGTTFRKVIRENINFNDVNAKIKNQRKQSEKFLNEALKNIESLSDKNSNKISVGTEGINHLCCGCGACVVSCPVGAISIEDIDGFQCAKIDNKKCISCQKCIDVCPLYGKDVIQSLENADMYSYKDRDINVLMKSSSGGAAHRMSKILTEKGYAVVGCCFDFEKQQAKHILIHADEADKIVLLQGSKYLQSDFSCILPMLKDLSEPVVVFGTPCQIAGAKRILGVRDNMLYVDLICHGVPSQKLYEKYQSHLNRKYNMDIDNLETIFRYKERGWRERYIYNTDSSKSHLSHQSKDLFFRMFECGFCYCDTCYECRWRNASEADIRLGDYWGKRFVKDTTGVSMMIALSKKGKEIISYLSSFGDLEPQTMEDYYNAQQFKNHPKPVFYDRLMSELSNEKIDLETIVKRYALPFERRIKINKILISVWRRLKYHE